MSVLNLLGAVAGAGKSRVALERAAVDVRQGKCVIYIAPTTRLLDEWAATFRWFESGVEPEVIHGENTDTVVPAVLRALSRPSDGGRMLFITWFAFAMLPFFPKRSDWILIVDEIPQAAMMVELFVPESHGHLTEHVELHPEGPTWSRVVVKSKNRLRRLAETNDASLKDGLGKLAKTLLSPHWTTYVRTAAFTWLVSGKGKLLTAHSVLRPRIFSDFMRVTILGANIRNSLLYMLWHSQGVGFVEDIQLRAGLRMEQHTGDNVTICYGVEHGWSKHARDHDGRAIFNRLVEAVSARLGDAPFGWVANKDIGAHLFKSPKAVQLPQVSHGLNSFQHLDHIIFLSARLPPPDHFAFLSWMGVGAEEVRRATSWEPTYQTALRGSARDPDNKNPKTIIVPDRPTAEFLRSLFPGSTLEKLPIDLSGVQPRPTRGRPKKHKNGTGRVQHHRALQDAHVRRVFDLIGTGVKMGPEDVAVPNSFQNTCNEITFKKGHLKNVTSFHRHSDPLDGRVTGSVFTDQYATDPLAIVNEEQEIFIKALRKAHRDIIAGKEDNLLFCPSVFDPTLSSETDRGLDNVLYANGVWLDFDGGDLTHKQLAAMFPFLRILVFNSYSSTKKLPRFRVYIPTNRIVSKEEYAFLTEQILQTVKDAGYRRKKKDLLNFGAKAHGIDTGKLHAASLFFLPCRPADPTGRIWKDFKGDGRAPLDVDDWALYAIPVEGDEPEPAPRDDVSGEWDEGRVARAVQRWDTKRTQAGMGDSELWILSQELSRAGVPRGEAQTILNDAARRASSPTERLKQARRIISTYRARTAA